MPREKAVQALLATLHETLAAFDQAPEVLERSYASGKWTLRELLVHLSDCEGVYTDRLRRLAAEDNPTLMAFDENRWASRLFYKTRDLGLAKLQFETARRSNIELARQLDDSVDARSGTHSEAGTRTFAQILTMAASHNEHHLEQIRAIVAGRTWTKK